MVKDVGKRNVLELVVFDCLISDRYGEVLEVDLGDGIGVVHL